MDVGLPEFFIVLVIVLLIFGPNRIAGLGGELGRTIRNFREGLAGIDEEDALPSNEQINQNGGTEPDEVE